MVVEFILAGFKNFIVGVLFNFSLSLSSPEMVPVLLGFIVLIFLLWAIFKR